MDNFLNYNGTFLKEQKIKINNSFKRLNISFVIKNSEIIIKVNPKIHSLEYIQNAIETQEEKIFYFLEKQKLKAKTFIKDIDLENKFFYLFGQKYLINFLDNKKQKIIYSNGIMLNVKSFNNKTLESNIRKELENKLLLYLEKRTLELSELMNIPNHQVEIRTKTGSWATNHVNSKKIFFNKNLFPFSKEIIDYVIIHELSHHLEPNHSTNFWKIVMKFCSNYKLLRRKLNNREY